MKLMWVPKLVYRHTVLFHMCVSNTNMGYIECFAKTAVENHTCDMATSLRIAQEAEMN